MLLGGTPGAVRRRAGAERYILSAGQVNAVAPFGLQAATTQVQVEYQGQTSQAMTAPVSAVTPGDLLTGRLRRGTALAFNGDGSLNSPGNPAAAGSVIRVYATGLGQCLRLGWMASLWRARLSAAASTPGNGSDCRTGRSRRLRQPRGRSPGGSRRIGHRGAATTPTLGRAPAGGAAGGQNSQPGITVAVRP